MTSPIPPLPDLDANAQAEYWLALRESPFFDREQERHWQAWLAASSENREAWQEAQQFFEQLENLSPAKVDAIERQLPPMTRSQQRQARGGSTRWISLGLPIAACLMLVLSVGWALHSGFFADFRTDTGEQRRIQLSDGSTVILNTASSLSVAFSEKQRVIRLHSGEAYFKVAADATRPFEVETSNGRVRALGTAFDIKQWQDLMAVTVYEHSVRVAFADGATVDSLPEGRRVVSRGGKAGLPESVNLKQAGAWQGRRLVFKEKPLQQVVDDLNRYRPGKIVIAGVELGEHLVTGVFDVNDPEQALKVIEQTLAVSETRLTDALVILHRQN